MARGNRHDDDPRLPVGAPAAGIDHDVPLAVNVLADVDRRREGGGAPLAERLDADGVFQVEEGPVMADVGDEEDPHTFGGRGDEGPADEVVVDVADGGGVPGGEPLDVPLNIARGGKTGGPSRTPCR